MTKLSDEQTQMLKPFGLLILDFGRKLAACSDQEMTELLAAAAACTDTNCGWFVYEAAQKLKADIGAERAYQAKKAARVAARAALAE